MPTGVVVSRGDGSNQDRWDRGTMQICPCGRGTLANATAGVDEAPTLGGAQQAPPTLLHVSLSRWGDDEIQLAAGGSGDLIRI